MARTPQNQSDLLATETRQFTDVSEMNEAYRGRADIRFIQIPLSAAWATPVSPEVQGRVEVGLLCFQVLEVESF